MKKRGIPVIPDPEIEKIAKSATLVKRSGVHGRGLFARRLIAKGERFLEYLGEKVTKAEANRRGIEQMEKAQKTGVAAVYLFNLNARYDIDGNVPSNRARLMNHSCNPNVEAVNAKGRIWFEALRQIQPGEELAFNYGLPFSQWRDHPCRCGAPDCIGYMVSRRNAWRIKRALQGSPADPKQSTETSAPATELPKPVKKRQKPLKAV